jgi:hypothetical protein
MNDDTNNETNYAWYNTRAENVYTWADAFGNWHAKVIFAESVDAGFLSQHYDRIRTKARRAIRAELLLRQAPDTLGPVRVVALPVSFDYADLTHSMTYVEKF